MTAILPCDGFHQPCQSTIYLDDRMEVVPLTADFPCSQNDRIHCPLPHLVSTVPIDCHHHSIWSLDFPAPRSHE